MTAIKSYLGHSIACAGADQLNTTLGIWKYGVIPGILTSGAIANDVHQKNLDILLEHKQVDTQNYDAAILNAKGFGGNNATASILSPFVTENMLSHKHGKEAITAYRSKNESVAEASSAYEALTNKNLVKPIYKFDHKVKAGSDISFTDNSIRIDGESMEIDLRLSNPYADMCD